jgi:hypothetical protein
MTTQDARLTELIPDRPDGGIHNTRLDFTPLELAGSAEVRTALATLGRTEDIAVSPCGGMVAIAGFLTNTIALVRLAVDSSVPARAIRAGAVHLMRSQELQEPHGLDFADEHTLLVASRAGNLAAFPVPEFGDGVSSSTIDGRIVVAADDPVPTTSPGSVRTRVLDDGLIEALVCDNYTHRVARYVMDTTDSVAVLDREELLHERLLIPDGVAVSPCGGWIAISNHETHEVLVYRFDDELGPTNEPLGLLWGVNYPHGLQFTADGRHLVVADAGLPFVYDFAAPGGDWSGRREPINTMRVMDDAEFNDGRYNPQEGGPKGLTIWDEHGIVLVTAETAPLRAFDLADVLGTDSVVSPVVAFVESDSTEARETPLRRAMTRLGRLESELTAVQLDRDDARAELSVASAGLERLESLEADLAAQAVALEHLGGLEARLGESIDELRQSEEVAAERARELELLRNSTSWRLTGPLRALANVLKGRPGERHRTAT